jgi:predicted Zn-ribbon and HTH transcriptional regulator
MTSVKKIIALLFVIAIGQTVNAQDNKPTPVKSQPDSVKVVQWICPMHAEVVSDKPAKCTKCGMNLSKKEIMKAAVVDNYVCPMHPGITSEKPAKCTKCGMDLVIVKAKSKG